MGIVGKMLEFVFGNLRDLGAGVRSVCNRVNGHAVIAGEIGLGVDVDEQRLLAAAFAEAGSYQQF
jgi:hypothetical protein